MHNDRRHQKGLKEDTLSSKDSEGTHRQRGKKSKRWNDNTNLHRVFGKHKKTDSINEENVRKKGGIQWAERPWKLERNCRTTQRTYKAAKTFWEGLTKGSKGPQHELLLGVVVERDIQDSFPYRIRHLISCRGKRSLLPTDDRANSQEWLEDIEPLGEQGDTFEFMAEEFSCPYPRTRQSWLALGYEWLINLC